MRAPGNFNWVNMIKIAERPCKNSFKNQGNQDGWARNSDQNQYAQYLSPSGYLTCVACGDVKTKYAKPVDMINHLWVSPSEQTKKTKHVCSWSSLVSVLILRGTSKLFVKTVIEAYAML